MDGMLVLDFTTLLPGPLATLWLREAGARVIKIERPPIGDEMREYVPRFGSTSVNFAMLKPARRASPSTCATRPTAPASRRS